MSKEHNPGDVWTNEQLQRLALQHGTRHNLQRAAPGAYYAALNRGLLDILFSQKRVPWTKKTNEEITAEASKYVTRNEFRHNNLAAYNSAYYRGLLDTLFPIKRAIPAITHRIPVYCYNNRQIYTSVNVASKILAISATGIKKHLLSGSDATKGYRFRVLTPSELEDYTIIMSLTTKLKLRALPQQPRKRSEIKD